VSSVSSGARASSDESAPRFARRHTRAAAAAGGAPLLPADPAEPDEPDGADGDPDDEPAEPDDEPDDEPGGDDADGGEEDALAAAGGEPDESAGAAKFETGPPGNVYTKPALYICAPRVRTHATRCTRGETADARPAHRSPARSRCTRRGS
jgi:hypothetical protein